MAQAVAQMLLATLDMPTANQTYVAYGSQGILARLIDEDGPLFVSSTS